MNEIVTLQIGHFALIYLLLLIVLFVMKKCKINQTRLLFVASMRMTAQLILAGLILTWIFENPHPLITVSYILLMTGFAIYMVLQRNKTLNRNFKLIASASLAFTGISVMSFFITVVVGVNLFHPQYTIPISGMVIGNAVTGMTLGLKTFNEAVGAQRPKIDALLNMGATPRKALMPFVNGALETALLPTLNAMLSMGIIALPGMMTGQILSGTMPMTAIFYQIAILIAQCTVTCLSVFFALFFGHRTLYNERAQLIE